MNMTITARLFVKSQRKGMSLRDGNMAAITCGMVSPTMIQNAIMPPNALCQDRSVTARQCRSSTYKAHCATYIQCQLDDHLDTSKRSYRDSNQSRLAEALLHCCLEGICTTKLGVRNNETYCPIDLNQGVSIPIVARQSLVSFTVIVRTISSTMPIVKPACRKAYG